MNKKLIAGIILILFSIACFMPCMSGKIGTLSKVSNDEMIDGGSDQFLDLAVVNKEDNDVSVLIGDGNGGFEPHQDYPVGSSPGYIVAGDFDMDGFLDLAVTNSNSNDVSILQGDGNGGFEPHQDYPVGNDPKGIVTGDFDMDGFLDLAITNYWDHDISALLNDGNGGFEPHQDYPVGNQPLDIVAGDFNLDQILDLAVTNFDSHSISIILNNGTGGFEDRKDYDCHLGPLEVHPVFITAGDFNTDGFLDLALTLYRFGHALCVILSDGNGWFVDLQILDGGVLPIHVVTDDFNQDSYLDLAVTDAENFDVNVLLGDGTGNFSDPQDYHVGNYPLEIVAGDFNVDGFLDLAVTNYLDDNVSVLLGDGMGGFGNRQDYPVGYGPEGIVAGDFNSNNPPDKPFLDGPTFGKPNVELCYTVKSTDPDGDDVMYVIDWDDGTTTETDYYPHSEPIEVFHTYKKMKIYTIRAKAKDTHDAESNWTYFDVEIPRNKATYNSLFLWFLERFPNAFPILRYILGI